MKRALLYSMVVVNALIVAVFSMGWSINLALVCIQGVIVITCIVLTYKSIRHKEGSLERDLLLIAAVFLSPLLLVLVSLVLASCMSGSGRLQNLIMVPVLSAYYWIPSYLGIPYLFIAVVMLWVAWRYGTYSIGHKAILMIYSVTLLLCVGYVVWWYVTGQTWSYL